MGGPTAEGVGMAIGKHLRDETFPPEAKKRARSSS
jgi:hypothetical protein